jgi:hypothetical protein
VPKGYRRIQFIELWERYLAAEGVAEPLHRYKPTATGTSSAFQSATPEPDVAFGKCEKPLGPNDCSGVAAGKGGNGPAHANGESFVEVGLSWRTIDQLAGDVEDWAYGRRHEGDVAQDDLEAEIRRRLAALGILPEGVEFESDRVLRCLFEGRDAVRMAINMTEEGDRR